MRILLLFRQHDVLRVTDVSEELGVAHSTAHRLLSTLAFRGFTQQVRNSRTYRAGPALMELQLAPEYSILRELAATIMAKLAESVNETINLMILEGENVRFISSFECRRPVRVGNRLGAVLPAHATAGGKVLLSSVDEAKRPGNLNRLTTNTITDSVDFGEEIFHIQRMGYAINQQESISGLCAIAVGIQDAKQRTIAALAVSTPADRGGNSTLRSYISPLRSAASAIEEQLENMYLSFD